MLYKCVIFLNQDLCLVEAWYSLEQYIGLKEDKLSPTTVDFIRSEGNLVSRFPSDLMKSTVVDESLSSFKPMYCSREYQASTRLIQQYEKSILKTFVTLYIKLKECLKWLLYQ